MGRLPAVWEYFGNFYLCCNRLLFPLLRIFSSLSGTHSTITTFDSLLRELSPRQFYHLALRDMSLTGWHAVEWTVRENIQQNPHLSICLSHSPSSGRAIQHFMVHCVLEIPSIVDDFFFGQNTFRRQDPLLDWFAELVRKFAPLLYDRVAYILFIHLVTIVFAVSSIV